MKKIAVMSMIAIMCIVCTGCTSAVTNADNYFSNTSTILAQIFSGNDSATKSSDEKTDAVSGIALQTPGNFSVNENGEYSFNGVENAALYILYFCDPQDSNPNSYMYSSVAITAEDGVEKYTGKCSDIVQFAYGEYDVKVRAFPTMGDEVYTMSDYATCQYTYAGTQDDPQIEYFWNTFDSTLTVQISNIDAYTYEAYPDELVLTFTNVNDEAEKVEVSFTDISDEQSSFKVDTLKRGETYQITAFTESKNNCVTNPVSDTVLVAEEVTAGDLNVISDQYACSDGIDGGRLNYPRIYTELNLNEEGKAGDISLQYPIQTKPIAANAGASYSFDVVIEMTGKTLEGSLELKSDGSFELREFGSGPCAPSSIGGFWLDNGDGTATLCYDESTISIG